MPELSQFTLCLVAVAKRAALVEFQERALEFRYRTVALAGLRERSARERSRKCGLDWGTGLVCGSRRRECPIDSEGRVAGVQSDGRRGAIRPRPDQRKRDGGGSGLGAGGCARRVPD